MRWLAAVSAMVFVGACRCGTPPETCGTTEITFETPMEDAMVAGTIDVVINAKRDGKDVTLTGAQLSTRLQSSTMFSAARVGTLLGNKASFTGVTLETGVNLIRVSVESDGVGDEAKCTGAETIQVTVSTTTPPDVTSFNFAGDANADKIVNATEYTMAGNRIAAIINATSANGCAVEIVDQGSSMSYGSGMVQANGIATIDLNLPNSMDATYNLQARIMSCGGRMHDFANDPESRAVVRIDRVPPTCNLMAPSRDRFGPMDDADPMAPDFQIDALGESTGANTIELRIVTPPQTTGPQMAGAGMLSRRFTVPTADGTYRVEFIASDIAGNSCTGGRDITIDFTAPTCAITSPAVAMSPYNTFNVPLGAMVTGALTGNVTFNVSGSTTATVGPVPYTNGTASTPFSFSAVGMATVTATVTDEVGNVSQPCPAVTVQINGAGCPISFSNPSMNPALLTSANDLNPGLADLQYEFRVQTSVACAGRTVTLFRGTGANRMMLATSPTNGSGLFASQQTLMDSNNMPVIYEVEIDDGSGNVTAAQVSVTVSLALPAITQPSAANNPLNAGQDLDRAILGAQRSLSFSPAPPSGYMATICSSIQVNGSPGACPGDATFFVMPGGSNLMVATPSFTFPEGTYTMKIVFTNGANHVQGIVTGTFLVDTVRPTVMGVTFQSDANADKRLNLTELPTGSPVAVVTTMGAEDGSAVQVRHMGTVVGSGTVTANSASVTLSSLGITATTEQDYSLVVTVVDAANNGNVTANPTTNDPLNAQALFTVRVDRMRPVTTLQLPNQAQLGIADDADAASGYQVRVTAATSNDVGTSGLQLAVAGGNNPPAQSVTPSNGVGTALFNVSMTGTTQYTVTATATDESGNVETSPPSRMVTVDLDAPTCDLTAPTAAGQPSGGYPNFANQTTAMVTGGDGLQALVFTTVGMGMEQQIDSMLVTSGMASKLVTYPSNGMQVVRVQVTDLAGNSCSDSETITINAMGCPIAFTAPSTNPAFLNRNDDTNMSTATTLEYTLTGTTGCPNAQIRFFRGMGAGRTELPGSPAMTSGSGTFSFPVSLPEGQELLSADMNVNMITTNSVNVTVDLTPPMLSAVSPSGASLFFVAPENLNRLAPANPAYVEDTMTGMPGAQFNVSLSVTGAIGGTAAVYYAGGMMPVSSVNVTADGPLAGGIGVTLPHNTSGMLEIRVTDAAGNTASSMSSAVVDVVRPDPPTSLMGNVVAGQERRAEINLSWGPSGDDGPAASGMHAGYIVRWTNSTVQPGGIASPVDFFDSTKVNTSEADSPWSSSTINRQLATPPLTTIYAYVRAKDEVGNYSDQATQAIDNTGISRRTIFTNPRTGGAGTDNFGEFLAAGGSLNMDATDDLVVGFNSASANRVFVYYGGANFATAMPQEIQPPEATNWSAFGIDVSVGDCGNGAIARADLLVSAGTSYSGAGRAVLYFGTPGAATLDTSPANYVIFGGTAGQGFGRTAQIIPDINGDGLSEVLISAGTESSNRGRVYLFFGRSIAQWLLLGGTIASPIQSSSADRSFWGPFPVAAGTGGNRYGQGRGGMANIGAIGSARPDFTIAASREAVNRLNLFSGDTVVPAAPGTTYTTGTDGSNPDQSMQTIAVATGTTTAGIGHRVQGLFNAVGTTANDVMVSWPAQGQIRFYDRTAAMLSSSPFTTITGAGARLFGVEARVIDYTGDGVPDVAVGENSTVAGSGWWFFVNRGVAGAEFDTSAGSGFFNIQQPSVAGGHLGAGMAVGDFNGDTRPDIAVNDGTDGIGKVFVWH